MKVTVTKCDGCQSIIKDSRDIFILKVESLGTDPDPAGGHSEHRQRDFEFCPSCLANLRGSLATIAARKRK